MQTVKLDEGLYRTDADNGVTVAGFSTTELPPAIAGPTLCATRFNGSLNGVIAAMIPMGNRK